MIKIVSILALAAVARAGAPTLAYAGGLGYASAPAYASYAYAPQVAVRAAPVYTQQVQAVRAYAPQQIATYQPAVAVRAAPVYTQQAVRYAPQQIATYQPAVAVRAAPIYSQQYAIPQAVNYQPAVAVRAAPVYTQQAVRYAPQQIAYQPQQVAYAQAAPLAVAKVHAVQPEPFDPHPQYNYGYSVSDALTGDQKTAQESRDGDAVQGSYSLVEPDGAVRTVTYTADDVHGFNAVVSRSAPQVQAVKAVHTIAPQVAYAAAPALQYASSAAYGAPAYYH